ncbi:MAG: beta-propeller domain-containing protein [Firmicutes bacterium]|nr:beta-propeller domain-containing protein [Bacillota bacterium]
MKDYDFIKDRFEQDGLEPPESLSPDAIRARLAEQPQHPAKRPANADPRPAFSPKHPWRRPLIAFAACACLALALIPVNRALSPGLPSASSADDSGLLTFSSQRQLDRAVAGLVENQYPTSDVTILENLTGREDLAEAPDNEMSGTAGDSAENYAQDTAGPSQGTQGKTQSAAGTPDHSTTYTQVEDVDEADIVKTDGNYIYYVSRVENQVIIARAKDGRTKRVAAVANHGNTSTENLYIRGGQLIVIGQADSEILRSAGSSWRSSTVVTVYDVTDPAKPEKTGQYIQTGNLLSSRLVDGRICLVTDDPIYNTASDNIPMVSCGEELSPIELKNIRCFPDAVTAAYTVIGLVDPRGEKLSADSITTSAVLGGSQEIYCSGPNLYVTGNAAEKAKKNLLTGRTSQPDSQNTRILRVSLSKGKVKYRATGVVSGWINNQFSMDEYKGYFRVATTSAKNGEDVNNLYVLDEKMKETGSLHGFAADEHIKAVRYMGSQAYVITYRQTDPLFIVDLSDPANPTIQGHVKISGYSTLLVPVDKDHVLGFGFSTETGEFGEYTNGLKLALFDVSDPMNPKVADSWERAGIQSEIQNDHRALLVGPDADFYAIPYSLTYTAGGGDDPVTIFDDAEELPTDGDDTDVADGSGTDVADGSGTDSADTDRSPEVSDSGTKGNPGILMISAKGGKIKILRDIPSKEELSRCIYIGDWLYGLTWEDDIESFPMK